MQTSEPLLEELKTAVINYLELHDSKLECIVDDLWKQWRLVIRQPGDKHELFAATLGCDAVRLRSVIMRDRNRDFSFSLNDLTEQFVDHIAFCLSADVDKPIDA